MTTKALLSEFNATTRNINYASCQPTMSKRTMASMLLLEVRFGSPERADGTVRKEGWYGSCPKCNGTGIWDNQYAVEDQYFHEPGRHTCFACGATNNGWFRLPRVDHYQQSCMLWIMMCIHQERDAEIYRVARSEVRFVTKHVPKYCEDNWMCQMADFWNNILNSMNRRKEGGEFLTEGDVAGSPMLQRTFRAWDKLLENNRRASRETAVGLPHGLIAALEEAWGQ